MLLLAAFPAGVFAQPPAVGAPKVGVVVDIGAGRILLSDGTIANIAPQAVVVTAEGEKKALRDVLPGQLVEAHCVDELTVVKLVLLPALPKTFPMSKFDPPQGKIVRCTWQHEGKQYKNSFRTAYAVMPVATCLGIRATVCYEPKDPARKSAIFRVVGYDDQPERVVWEREVRAGEAVELRCSFYGLKWVALTCLLPEGAQADDAECVWADPELVLRVYRALPVPELFASELARRVGQAIREAGAEPVAIARPQVLGLSPEVGRELLEKLLPALKSGCAVAATLEQEGSAPPRGALYEEARKAGAEALLVLRVRYDPPGFAVVASLYGVDSAEQLASFELNTFTPLVSR